MFKHTVRQEFQFCIIFDRFDWSSCCCRSVAVTAALLGILSLQEEKVLKPSLILFNLQFEFFKK